MGREYEPTVGQWYEDLENDETFQVLRVDEDREIVEIQHLDGDIEELDVDDWAELDLELTEEPEGWSGSKSEKDEDEDDDEDWDEDEDEDEDDDDDDDLDDEDDEDRDEYRAAPEPRGASDPLQPAVLVGCFTVLNGDQLRAQRAGLLSHFAACHAMFRAAVNQRADTGEHGCGA